MRRWRLREIRRSTYPILGSLTPATEILILTLHCLQEIQRWVKPGLYLHDHFFLNLFCCCCCSVAKLCPILQPCGPQHSRLPCLSLSPRVCSNSCHWVGDTIQPSHPLSSPSPQAFNLSQHQGLFKWVSYSYQVASRILGPKWYVVNNSTWPMQACLSGLPSCVSPGLWQSLGQLVISLLLPSDSEGDQSPAHSVVKAWSDS